MRIRLGYGMSDAAYRLRVRTALQRADTLVSEAEATAGPGVCEKVRAVHDLLISKVVWHKHGMGTIMDHSILGPLLDSTGVCDGISLTASLLLSMMGVRCAVVGGEVTGLGPHAWNVVDMVPGKVHRGHMDIVFDAARDPAGAYAFFLISDSECSDDRTWDVQTLCDGSWSYHRRMGLYAEDAVSLDAALRRGLSMCRGFSVRVPSSMMDEREVTNTVRDLALGIGADLDCDTDTPGLVVIRDFTDRRNLVPASGTDGTRFDNMEHAQNVQENKDVRREDMSGMCEERQGRYHESPACTSPDSVRYPDGYRVRV